MGRPSGTNPVARTVETDGAGHTLQRAVPQQQLSHRYQRRTISCSMRAMRPMASVNRRRREKQARIDYQLLRSNGAHWNATVALVTLRVQPLTPNLWPAIEDLFEGATACNHCWC